MAYSGKYALFLEAYHDRTIGYTTWASQMINYRSDVPLKIYGYFNAGGWDGGYILIEVTVGGTVYSYWIPVESEQQGEWFRFDIEIPAGTLEKVLIECHCREAEPVESFVTLIDEIHLNPVK